MHVGLEFFPEINAHLISFSFFLVHAAAAGFIRTSSKAFSTSFSKNSLMIMEPSLLSDVQFQCHFALFRNGAKFLAIIRTLKWMIFYSTNFPLYQLLSVPISINSHQIWHFNDVMLKISNILKLLITNILKFWRKNLKPFCTYLYILNSTLSKYIRLGVMLFFIDFL